PKWQVKNAKTWYSAHSGGSLDGGPPQRGPPHGSSHSHCTGPHGPSCDCCRLAVCRARFRCSCTDVVRPRAANQMVAAVEGGKVAGRPRQGVRRLRTRLRQRPGYRCVRQDWRMGDGRRFGAALNVRSLIGRSCRRSLFVVLVPRRGLEPPRCYPLVPETSASTNSATWAVCG